MIVFTVVPRTTESTGQTRGKCSRVKISVWLKRCGRGLPGALDGKVERLLGRDSEPRRPGQVFSLGT
jgi:hypothetical protein